MTEQLKIELSDSEIEYLKTLHIAQTLKDMTRHPGWLVLTDISAKIIERLENQHLNFAERASKDAYYASGVRLSGARQYAQILMEEVVKSTDILNHPLRVPDKTIDPADLDGELEKVN